MFKRILILILSTIASILLAACAPSTSPANPPTVAPTAVLPTATIVPASTVPPTLSPANTPTTASDKVNTPMSTTPASAPSGPEPAQVTQAKQDLAKRLSVQTSQIELVSFQPVSWADSSLGCPQPGMMYSQIVTDGYRIQLRASGKVYEYHASRTGIPFLCENPKPPVSGAS